MFLHRRSLRVDINYLGIKISLNLQQTNWYRLFLLYLHISAQQLESCCLLCSSCWAVLLYGVMLVATLQLQSSSRAGDNPTRALRTRTGSLARNVARLKRPTIRRSTLTLEQPNSGVLLIQVLAAEQGFIFNQRSDVRRRNGFYFWPQRQKRQSSLRAFMWAKTYIYTIKPQLSLFHAVSWDSAIKRNVFSNTETFMKCHVLLHGED